MTINDDGLNAAREKLESMGKPLGLESDILVRGVIEAYFDNVGMSGRRKLRDGRGSEYVEGVTTKFEVGGVEGYIIVNCFPDGTPGEIFIQGIGKEGSTIRGLMDLIAILISVGLQYGVPLNVITTFMCEMNFEPKDSEASSIPDWIGQFLEDKYGPR